MPLKADQILDREFLDLRARILEIAASLDRLDRSEGDASSDPRLALLLEGIHELQSGKDGRAERLQLHFSLPYDEDWKKNLGYPVPR